LKKLKHDTKRKKYASTLKLHVAFMPTKNMDTTTRHTATGTPFATKCPNALKLVECCWQLSKPQPTKHTPIKRQAENQQAWQHAMWGGCGDT
jgi:hypothetical protein